MPDHIHVFLGLNVNQSISSLLQNIKTESSKWINHNGFCRSRFEWQTGYGAFSYAKSDVPNVISYIQNQEAHHKKQTFLEEYIKLLTDFDIAYNDQYIFKQLE